MTTLVHRKWGKTCVGWRWWFGGFSMLDGVLLKVDEVSKAALGRRRR
jgi:hypothetical protein